MDGVPPGGPRPPIVPDEPPAQADGEGAWELEQDDLTAADQQLAHTADLPPQQVPDTPARADPQDAFKVIAWEGQGALAADDAVQEPPRKRARQEVRDDKAAAPPAIVQPAADAAVVRPPAEPAAALPSASAARQSLVEGRDFLLTRLNAATKTTAKFAVLDALFQGPGNRPFKEATVLWAILNPGNISLAPTKRKLLERACGQPVPAAAVAAVSAKIHAELARWQGLLSMGDAKGPDAQRMQALAALHRVEAEVCLAWLEDCRRCLDQPTARHRARRSRAKA